MSEAGSNSSFTVKWLLVGAIALVANDAEAKAGQSQTSDLGAIYEEKIQIRVSVRPSTRIRPLAALSKISANLGTTPNWLCLWSNYEITDGDITAQWSDGRPAQLRVKAQQGNECRAIGAQLVQVETTDSHDVKREIRSPMVLIVAAQ